MDDMSEVREQRKPVDDWQPISGMEDNFSLYSAIRDPKSGDPISIPDIIVQLSKTEKLEEGESICYIGAGNFAVACLGDEERAIFELKRVIAYEDKHESTQWRNELKFKADFPYRPNPKSLRSLYTNEEIQAMPKFV